ncbi:MAG: TIGR04283 family arsenosugar biosynthesis glycosyltransferase [Bryobacteraceae bacterium]
MPQPSISIIVPARNEESTVAGLLENLCAAGADEILLVDGASTDRTVEIASVYSEVRVIAAAACRAVQMNAGAEAARGDVLLFLHADVRLSDGALAGLRAAMSDASRIGGNFDIRYDGEDWVCRIFDWVNRWRRFAGIFYGDSGIFCRRNVFVAMGGYQPWPILEDYEFARRLWKTGRLAFLRAPLRVSDRRWRNAGLFTTMWQWVAIQGLYTLGVSPVRLVKWYEDIR